MAQQTTAKYSIRQAISRGEDSSGGRADKKNNDTKDDDKDKFQI